LAVEPDGAGQKIFDFRAQGIARPYAISHTRPQAHRGKTALASERIGEARTLKDFTGRRGNGMPHIAQEML
jgi:hypothetical protein